MDSNTSFTILPSVGSMMIEFTLVIVLFILFIIYVSYLSAYKTGFKPNFVMFINFLMDDYSGTSNFQTYINNIVADKKHHKNKKESFSTINPQPNILFSHISKTFSLIHHSFLRSLFHA